MIFYDFEVFKHDWLVVVKDVLHKKVYRIHNDPKAFQEIFKPDENRIWVGYNSTHYDQNIAAGVMGNLAPQQIYQLSTMVLNDDIPTYRALKHFGVKVPYKFFSYDTQTDQLKARFQSLKQLEGFMGHDIRECTVPWDIDRPLTPEELEEVFFYCEHDVDETMEVFLQTKAAFNSKMGLIKAYKLGLNTISRTSAQISAIVLGARKTERHDEFNITIVDTLRISKYKEVVDWYRKGLNYGEQLKVMVAGVLHVFGIGGIHGAIKNYLGEGLYIMSDVASMHPALMIGYGFLSRNVADPEDYTRIRDTRIKLKAAKDPQNESYKLVLNATNGAAKDRFNALYDPVQNNNVCVTAQLALLDLIERVEDLIEELVQSNTDGILVKLRSRDDLPEYLRRCKEWETRMRMELEHDEYVKVVQKDVNNYIVIDKDGGYKRKGAYVKKLSEIDYQLPIVNKALIEYFVNGTPVEETINGCRSLREFQTIVKTGKAEYVLHGGQKQPGKVFRVFASKENRDGGLYRFLNGRNAKVGNTPIHCFIDNTDITRKRCPRKLDKQWYIDVANDRISDFLGVDNHNQLSLF